MDRSWGRRPRPTSRRSSTGRAGGDQGVVPSPSPGRFYRRRQRVHRKTSPVEMGGIRPAHRGPGSCPVPRDCQVVVGLEEPLPDMGARTSTCLTLASSGEHRDCPPSMTVTAPTFFGFCRTSLYGDCCRPLGARREGTISKMRDRRWPSGDPCRKFFRNRRFRCRRGAAVIRAQVTPANKEGSL